MSDGGAPGAAACWDPSQNALGRQSCGKTSSLFSVAGTADGQLLVASLGKWEESAALLFGGPRWKGPERPLVCLWENFDELLPMGRDAEPIISSWERKQERREGDERAASFASLFVTETPRRRLFGRVTMASF